MASRIPQEFIDQLLDRVDLVELVGERVSLRRSGSNHLGLCPFHDEKTPSFSVSRDKQLYHCFGCGAGGNALGFLMEFDRLEFPAAVEVLARREGLPMPDDQRGDDGAGQARTRAWHGLMEQVARYYQAQLSEHPAGAQAQRYLAHRGVDEASAKAFGVGFAPPGSGHLVQRFAGQEAALLELGLLGRSEGGRLYDRFRHRLLFPIRDLRGRTLGFGGRVLGDGHPKYLNSPETPLFHKGRVLYGLFEAMQARPRPDRLYFVEGYMDVVALAQAGVAGGVATLGTATSRDHLQLALRRVSQLVFCFDGDQAGRRAARQALETALPLMDDGRQVHFLMLPDGEDPDSLIRRGGAAAWDEAVARAQPLSEYLFAELARQVDLSTVDGRARLASEARPLLALLPDGAFRLLMTEELAARTGIAPSAMRELLEPRQPPLAPPERARPETPAPRRRRAGSVAPERWRHRLPPERLALALLLQQPQFAAQVELPAELAGARDGATRLLLRLMERARRDAILSPAALLGHGFGFGEQELLAELATIEVPLAPEAARVEFAAALKRLCERERSSELDALLERPLAELSVEDRKVLNELLQRPGRGD
ncbi:MAG: DNA primase [Pseudomonadota bacterium]|nr:DNA primase [Pseudomonadota bacterium]